MSILYTPAGDTDPIRDCYDGAMLHIIRTYWPEYVRIFLSAEMSAKEKTGIYTLKRLSIMCLSANLILFILI